MSRHLGGWVKLHRKILTNELWDDINAYRLFETILLLSNHSDSSKCVRGEIITGYDDLCYWSKLPRGSIGRLLQRLAKKHCVIDLSPASRGSKITVLNYNTYQATDPEPISNRSETDLIMKNKEIRNKKKTNTYAQNQPTLSSDLERHSLASPKGPELNFEWLYECYPKKVGKKKGMQRLQREVKTFQTFSKCLKACLNYGTYVQTHKIKDQYVKHFSTWVNEWEDWFDLSDGKGKDKWTR